MITKKQQREQFQIHIDFALEQAKAAEEDGDMRERERQLGLASFLKYCQRQYLDKRQHHIKTTHY